MTFFFFFNKREWCAFILFKYSYEQIAPYVRLDPAAAGINSLGVFWP